MPDRPTVSIVMSTFNRRELLEASLAAIARQDWPADRLQVVVTDNGCTDDTAAFLASQEVALPVDVVTIPDNVPPAVSRNRGLQVATGDVIAFTDDDCQPVPSWITRLVGALQDPDVGIAQGLTQPDPEQRIGPLSRSQWTLTETGLYETCNIAYRRSALALEGDEPFSTVMPDTIRRYLGSRLAAIAFGEDTELAWRVKRHGVRARFVKEAVVHHHVYQGDLGYVVRRSILAAGFPALVRACPELRRTLLWKRVFLGRRRALWWLGAIGVVGTVAWHPAALAAVVPYLNEVFQPFGRRRRLKSGLVRIVRDGIEGVALAYGSVRARRVVL